MNKSLTSFETNEQILLSSTHSILNTLSLFANKIKLAISIKITWNNFELFNVYIFLFTYLTWFYFI